MLFQSGNYSGNWRSSARVQDHHAQQLEPSQEPMEDFLDELALRWINEAEV
jgi:hypothetical protein